MQPAMISLFRWMAIGLGCSLSVGILSCDGPRPVGNHRPQISPSAPVSPDVSTPTTASQSGAPTPATEIHGDVAPSEETTVQTERIQFGPGETSALREDGVERGARRVYVLGAVSGQTLNVQITSLEDNAVFDVIAPDGTVLTQEVKDASVRLPSDGDYQIVVGGTRGNASYSLTVAIP